MIPRLICTVANGPRRGRTVSVPGALRAAVAHASEGFRGQRDIAFARERGRERDSIRSPRALRLAGHRMDRAVDAGRVHLRARRHAGGRPGGVHRRWERARRASAPGRHLGRRLLVADPVHAPDGDDDHLRLRVGDVAACVPADPGSRRTAADGQGRGGARRRRLDAQLAPELGIQPDFQRGAGARGRAAGADGRLPRAWRQQLSRDLARCGRKGSADRPRCRWRVPRRCRPRW